MSDKFPHPMVVKQTYLRHSGGTKDYRVTEFHVPKTGRSVVIFEWGKVFGKSRHQSATEKHWSSSATKAVSDKIRSKLKRGYDYYPDAASAITEEAILGRSPLESKFAQYMQRLEEGDSSEVMQSPLEFLYNMKEDQDVVSDHVLGALMEVDEPPAKPAPKVETLADKVKRNADWGLF